MRNALFALTLAFVVGCGSTTSTALREEGKGKPSETKRVTRQEAKQMLAGKSHDEVKAVLGQPEKTTERPASVGGSSWFYPYSAQVVWDSAGENPISVWVDFDAAGRCYDVR